jgi:hypothetical protein
VGIDSSYRLQNDDDSILYVSSAGQFLRLKSTDLTERLNKAGTYRILALPCNYWLIVMTYRAIDRLREKYNFGELLIGSPLACKPSQSNYQNLYSVSHSQVQDLLPNCWHRADGNSYRNYLLCHIFNTVDKEDSRIVDAYQCHVLKPYFDFIGLTDPALCSAIIAKIVDPRWHVSIEKSSRLNKFNYLFGITSERVYNAWKDKKKLATDSLSHQILSAILHMDRHSFLLQDLETGLDGPNMLLKACRRLLAFLVRNWLNVLTELPYFEPHSFFKQNDTVNAYCQISIKG